MCIIIIIFFALLLKRDYTYDENKAHTQEYSVRDVRKHFSMQLKLDPDIIRKNIQEKKPKEPAKQKYEAVNKPKKEKIKVQEATKSNPYTKEDLYIMSHVINGEAGMSWASDKQQQLVGLVVMNRVKHPAFPSTIKGVVFQKGQYSCTRDGNYYKKQSARVIANAKKVLTGNTDVRCPPNVVYQSNERHGSGVFCKIYDKVLNTTTYFCYK